VRVEVERVIISEIYDQQAVIFREVDGERRLPFVLGIFEATTIDRTLKKLSLPRPLTHDAWLATIAALGAKLQAACIHDLDVDKQTYFAELRFDRAGEMIRLDARPSDALTLALKAGVPFLIANRILADASGS
jgi:bifunctional DNase/RNase